MQKNLSQELKEALAQRDVRFSFYKASGDVREAYGTTNMGVVERLSNKDIAEQATPTGRGRKSDGVICFWDLEQQGWRSCKENSIISVENV